MNRYYSSDHTLIIPVMKPSFGVLVFLAIYYTDSHIVFRQM